MAYTLTQAAEATGISKSTILRAIKSNKVSAARDQRNQGWLIEPAELHRLYPLASNDAAKKQEMTRHETPSEVNELRAKLEAATQRIADKDETIADLRRRLDAEGEERRRLTAILTDQRAKPPDVITMPLPAAPASVEAQPAPPPHASPATTSTNAPALSSEVSWWRKMVGGR
jgi:excisionase family DNA binding protein